MNAIESVENVRLTIACLDLIESAKRLVAHTTVSHPLVMTISVQKALLREKSVMAFTAFVN